MNIYRPLSVRQRFAHFMLWLVLVVLVNLLTNVNDRFLQIEFTANQIGLFDDDDSIYEWLAEDLFGIEHAIAEGQDNSDDDELINPLLKINLSLPEDRGLLFSIPVINLSPVPLFDAESLSSRAKSIFIPPPNI